MRGKFLRHQQPDGAITRFNEARALCAGSFGVAAWLPVASPCFNEARALCAGSSSAPAHIVAGEVASMRPAHCAREVLLAPADLA